MLGVGVCVCVCESAARSRFSGHSNTRPEILPRSYCARDSLNFPISTDLSYFAINFELSAERKKCHKTPTTEVAMENLNASH